MNVGTVGGTHTELAFALDAALAAAYRWAGHKPDFEKFEAAVAEEKYSRLDSRERIVKRVNRLMGRLQRLAPSAAREVRAEVAAARESVGEREGATEMDDLLLERVIGTSSDFLFIEFFDQALAASRAVGRVVTQLRDGRRRFGTGFLVAPGVLMTNHHVLTTPEEAAVSHIELNYQHDMNGEPLTPRSFPFRPGRLYLANEELDFAIVAVDGGDALRAFGWLPLIKEEGKIVVGEPINIVQHPLGKRKQVVLRENRLLKLLDLHAHYEADTEPGSSGSPVFNNQWEVVALHHSGVPRKDGDQLLRSDGRPWHRGDDPTTLAWVANEGIRVSRLVSFIAGADLRQGPEATALVKRLLDGEAGAPPTAPRGRDERAIPDQDREETPVRDEPRRGASVSLTIPLRVSFTVDGLPERVSLATDLGDDSAPATEAVQPDPRDPRYARRPGYDAGFLGVRVPFPRLTAATRSKAFALPGLDGDERFVLKYHHYSVLFNKERRLAFAAGVNFDPTARFTHQRENDRWFYDPRVPRDLQAGESLYSGNPLDRGHLVRRADAGWGRSASEAKLANDDTFHFTNCSPQHSITNQGRLREAPPGLKLWGKLEDHVASQGRSDRARLCVFNGPVFRADDEEYRGVLLPREFWKVVAYRAGGSVKAAAFVLTQEGLIDGLEEEFQPGEYAAVQVRIQDLESKTGLDFGSLTDADALEQEGAEESFSAGKPAVFLRSTEDVVL